MTKEEKYVDAYLDGYYSEKVKDYFMIQKTSELEKIIKRAQKTYKKNIKTQKSLNTHLNKQQD